MKPVPVNLIQNKTFVRSWQEAAAFVDDKGAERVIGGPKENGSEVERKKIKDTCQIIELFGKAIDQLNKGEMHPKFPFGPKQLEEYCLQMTPEYVEKWQKMSNADVHKFRYLYWERFLFPYDQIEALKLNLAELIKHDLSSNRVQAITWRPNEDAFNEEPPCLQRVQVIYLGKDEEGTRCLDIRTDWRSRDINAWQSNLICLNRAFKRHVFEPNECKVVRWIDNCASLHCYEDRLDKLHEAAWYQRFGNQFFVE